MDAPPPNPQADELLAQSQAAALRGEHREGAQLAEAALALVAPEDLPRRALVQRWVALHQMRLGQPQVAVPAAFEAIALCRDLRDAAGEADALNTLSLTCHRLGLPRETVAYALQALAIARAQGDLRTECWAHGRAGIGYEALGESALSRRHTERALQLARQLGGEEEIFLALLNLSGSELAVAERCTRAGDLSSAAAELAAARAHAEEALLRARASGNTHRQATALGNLIESMVHTASADQAAALLGEYQTLAQAHGYRALELQDDFDLACLLRHRGRHALAVQRLEAVLRRTSPDDLSLRRRIEHALYDSYKALELFEPALAHHEVCARLERELLVQQTEAQLRLLRAQLPSGVPLPSAPETLREQVLAQRVQALEVEAEQRRLRMQAELLERSARDDPLTGLPKAATVEHVLAALRPAAPADRSSLSLLLLQLADAEGIAERHGRHTLDSVLATLGRLLIAHARAGDHLTRLEGQRFLVVTSASGANAHGQALLAACRSLAWNALAEGLVVDVDLRRADGRTDEQLPALAARVESAAVLQPIHSPKDPA